MIPSGQPLEQRRLPHGHLLRDGLSACNAVWKAVRERRQQRRQFHPLVPEPLPDVQQVVREVLVRLRHHRQRVQTETFLPSILGRRPAAWVSVIKSSSGLITASIKSVAFGASIMPRTYEGPRNESAAQEHLRSSATGRRSFPTG